MPIQSKSIWQQISNPRETYTDGYGAQREVYEPGYITAGRKIYNGIERFLNGPETVNIGGQEMPITTGAGALELMNMPIGLVGKIDDVPALSKNLRKIADKWDDLARYKLRRKINKQPEATKRIIRNAEKMYPQDYNTDMWVNYVDNRVDGVPKKPYPEESIHDFYDEIMDEYVNDRITGSDHRLMDILWRRGDLDGVKHPKQIITYEELPF